RIAVARNEAHAPRRLTQDFVANGMTVIVVDLLEEDEIDENDPDRYARARRQRNGLTAAILKQRPVGQPREAIVQGKLLEVFLVFALARNIGEHAHMMRDTPDGIAHFREAQQHGEVAAVFPAPPQLALPAPEGPTPTKDAAIKRFVVTAAGRVQ